MMDPARGRRVKKQIKVNQLNGEPIGMNYDNIVIIRVPDSLVLRIVTRSFMLAIFILALPFIGYNIGGSSSELIDYENVFDITGFESFPIIFQDLADEGLFKKGHKGLILSSGIGDSEEDLEFLNDNDIDFVIESDWERQSSIPDDSVDVVFTSSDEGTSKFVDRVLRVGGIFVMQLSNDPFYEFQRDSNYKIVYLRRFDSTVVAMRKTAVVDCSVNFPTKHRFCGVMSKAKKATLKGLEDVWLEPPRAAFLESSNQRNNFKFLPDLLGVSLQNYPRRLFITDDKGGSVEWFKEYYPKQNQEFEIYDLEIETNDMENVGRVPIGISEWMTKNVKKEDYVVMKAEAQIVQEMMEEKAINLIDELFLECKNQWQDGSKRAYWQCLALYGRLRDEGVAVHQWWN